MNGFSSSATAVDLSHLSPPQIVEPLDFETLFAARRDDFAARFAGFDALVESDPAIQLLQSAAYRDLLMRQDFNDRARELLLAFATGPMLDQLAILFGVFRLIESPADPDNGIEAVYEDDDTLRKRVVLAPEAFSVAGPAGAYVFHALELDGAHDLSDAWAYSEDEGATYSAGLFAGTTAYPDAQQVLAPEVLITILPTLGYGEADQPLLDRTYAAVNASERRPIGDKVTIEPAEIVRYDVEVEIGYRRGVDPALLIAEATARVEAYTESRRRIGIAAERLGLGGACYVDGAENVSLHSPALDVGGGPKQAAEVGTITVTAVETPGGWQ